MYMHLAVQSLTAMSALIKQGTNITCTHTLMHTHAHTRARMHTHTHTHMHTHTHTLLLQEFCRRSLIPHIVVLSDKELFFERKQVKVRTLEPSGKTSERIIGVAELTEFLQQRQGVDRCDSLEAQSSTRVGGPSNLDSFPSNARPPVNVTVVATVKLSGHFKRKIHDLVSTTHSLSDGKIMSGMYEGVLQSAGGPLPLVIPMQ